MSLKLCTFSVDLFSGEPVPDEDDSCCSSSTDDLQIIASEHEFEQPDLSKRA
jgi:hypothetical protein